MANPIRRLVQLILDRASAKKTEADAKEAIQGVEGALSSLKNAAKTIGAAIAAAFSINKISEFLTSAVRAAAAAETRFTSLAGTIDATGESFNDLEADIVASSEAFEAATIHDDDAYVEGLQRMIAITGDVGASMNNMGLAADVAARFFNGELGPAVDLVAKAMNGNTVALQKMGIQAESAQEALEILAARSMHGAEERAKTFGGRVQQLGNAWENFKEELGAAMLAGDGSATMLNALSAAVRTLRGWVDRNREAIALWVTRGVDFAIASVDVLLRAVKALALVLGGSLVAAWGATIFAASKGMQALARLDAVVAGLLLRMGATGLSGTILAMSAEMNESAKAIEEWASALTLLGAEDVKAGLRVLATPMFRPGQFRPRDVPSDGPNVSTDTPMISSNATTEADAALQAYMETMAQATIMSRLLGDSFDVFKAEASALETVLSSLAAAGFDETDPIMQEFANRLDIVRMKMGGLLDVSQLETEALEKQADAANELASALGAAMEGGLGPFAKQKAKQNLLEAAELGIRATMAALTGFGAGQAGVFAQGAARHLAIAAAWGSLGAGVSAGSATGAGGGSGGSMTPTAARGVSAAGSDRREPIGNDVTIVLRGAGFHALNPEVQRVVQGAMQEGGGRQGNVKVRVVRGEG